MGLRSRRGRPGWGVRVAVTAVALTMVMVAGCESRPASHEVGAATAVEPATSRPKSDDDSAAGAVISIPMH